MLLPHWPTRLQLRERLRLESGVRSYLWSQLLEALGMNETAIIETGVQWKAGGIPEKKPAEKQLKQPESEYREADVKGGRVRDKR